MALESLVSAPNKNSFVKANLYIASLLFQLGCRIRHFLYDKAFFSCFHASCPVVSVGNLAVGGTGKTPFIQKLVEELACDPGVIAIVSRGYRSELEQGGGHLVSNGGGPETSVSLAGDEAFWLAQNTNASVWVGKKRFMSIKQACLLGSKLIILEDGLQHRKVFRDVEIVLLDANDLWGRGYFLPRGYLRDLPSRLQKADFVVVTKLGENCDEKEIEKSIRQYTQAPIVGFGLQYVLEQDLVGKQVGAFCGIAKPDSFYKALKDQGLIVVETLTSRDHEIFPQKELEAFASSCKKQGAVALVCTEKDWVKLSSCSKEILPIFVLKMNFVCVWNENVWQEMKQTLHTRCNS